jgi:predicted nuclease of predicted toxin-antitoxin system
MKLYVDDDSIKKSLVALLRKAGHDVVVPGQAGLSNAPDPEHFLFAIKQRRVLLTKNYDDFKTLHLIVEEAGGQYPGM